MNKNYRMAKFININGKYVPYTNDTDLIKLQSEEIEKLNKGCKELEQQIDDLHKLETTLTNENEKLNNIINELESYLEQQWLEWKDNYNDEIVAMANEDKAILDKLKELKEGK